MAATTVKPFPHVRINVKDNSIANVQLVETLPVHRPLYVIRCQEGPVGVPVWCNNYSEACTIFGEETFNPANTKYFGRGNRFLKDTLTYNGAFIVRYLPKDDEYAELSDAAWLDTLSAKYVLFARVTKNDAVQQYEYVNGQRKLEFNEELQEWTEVKVTSDATPYTDGGDATYTGDYQVTFEYNGTDKTVTLTKSDVANSWGGEDGVYNCGLSIQNGKWVFYHGGIGSDAATANVDPYTVRPEDIPDTAWTYDSRYSNIKFTRLDETYVPSQPVATSSTEAGVNIVFGTRALGSDETNLVPRAIEGGFEFPLISFKALHAGEYGNDVAVKLFYHESFNDPADVRVYNTMFYNIGFGRREYNSSTINPITDIYNRENASFAINPATVNPDNGKYMDLATVLSEGFSDDSHVLPVDIQIYEKSFNEIGNIIAAYEKDEADADGNVTTIASLNGYDETAPIGALTADEKAAVKAYYITQDASDEQVAIAENLVFGYKVNVVSLTGITGIPYDHAILGEAGTGFTATNLNQNTYTYLEGGLDGTFVADNDPINWASDDHAMFQFANLTLPVLRDTIVENLHYPFTHIFDVGFSMRTKKAILKFLDVRDDFGAIMSAQVLMSDGSGRAVPTKFEQLNDQAKDESNVETLRSYALLMRESVLFGTDCMRASIYCHAGILVGDSDRILTPFTYNAAMWYAQYGNVDYMKADEPRGLPNAYCLNFRKWNWNNYRLDNQSRVWDEGANYVQFADMKRLFYPSLRTVYRASTSVLVDEWFVAAIIYAKYKVRETWAHFSGCNDYAEALQGSIKSFLDNLLAKLFNSKYAFTTAVYQTADEKEIGYIQHVKLTVEGHATHRVLDVDIITNRENFTPQED